MQHAPAIFTARHARRWALGLTLGLLALHLVAAGTTELDFDEAYYALWARNLSWGYVDHPPLVALWIRVSTTLFGDGPFGVRALSAIATACGTAGLVVLGRLLYPRRPALGWLAALLFAAMPLLAVAGFVTTPDVPLVVFWTGAVIALAHVWRTGSAWSWAGVGLASGCALQAKYSGFFLGAGIVLAMLAVGSLRRWFKHPAPYLAGVLALAVFAPVVAWNAGHDWVSFHKQFGRAAGSVYSGAYIGEYLGALAGLANPAVVAMACGAAWLAWRDRRAMSLAAGGEAEARRLLLALTVPMLLYFLKHALHDRVQGNWFAPVLPLLALLAADWATAEPDARWSAAARGRAVTWSSAGCVAIAALALAHFTTGILPVPPARDVGLQRLQGWRNLSDEVAVVAGPGTLVLTTGYGLASHLRLYGEIYGRREMQVEQVNERARWFFEDPARVARADGRSRVVYVAEAGREELDTLRARFAVVTEMARIERRFAGRVLKTYVVYRLERPSGAILMAPSFTLPL